MMVGRFSKKIGSAKAQSVRSSTVDGYIRLKKTFLPRLDISTRRSVGILAQRHLKEFGFSSQYCIVELALHVKRKIVDRKSSVIGIHLTTAHVVSEYLRADFEAYYMIR